MPIPNAKAGVFVAVNIAIVKDIWINHTATENFYPAGMFVDPATFAIADKATDIHFGDWVR